MQANVKLVSYPLNLPLSSLIHWRSQRTKSLPVSLIQGHTTVTGTVSFLSASHLLAAHHKCWKTVMSQFVKKYNNLQGMWVQLLGWDNPWRRKWQLTPALLPGKPRGQRSLAGYSPWSLKRVGHDLATKHKIEYRCRWLHVEICKYLCYLLALRKLSILRKDNKIKFPINMYSNM